MSIEVTCVQCGASHHVNNRLAGRRVRCPSCDTAVHVPEQEDAVDIQDEEIVAVEAIPEQVEYADMAMAEDLSADSYPETTAEVSLSDRPAVESSAAPASFVNEEDEDDEDDQVLQRKPRPEEEMDMTPMVDVTFLLLIFFMVTAAFSLQKSIEMPRQQTDAPSTSVVEEESEDLDMVEVQVDEFGSFLVMAPDWERETPGKQNLITALKEAISGHTDGMRLAIKVHELAKLHTLVDAMDAGTIAGYAELEVTQVEGF